MGLGTWAWGNKLLWGYEEDADVELQGAFDLAVDQGVRFFDTGDSYGTGELEGRAELLLGKFQREYRAAGGARALAADEVVVGTKLATYPWRVTAGQMEAALRASLRRLGRLGEEKDEEGSGGGKSGKSGSVELMQLHWSAANYAPWQEPGLRAGLVRCKRLGLAKAVGASNYGPVALRSLHKELEEQGVALASNQVQFSLLSRQPLAPGGVLDTCGELGICAIGYSPLALGLLSGKFTGDLEADAAFLPPGPRGLLFRQILPGLRPLLSTLSEVGSARGKTTAQVAINWCIVKGAVPIVGAKNAAQVRENLGALGWRLSASEVAALDEAADAVPRGATQNVFQTK